MIRYFARPAGRYMGVFDGEDANSAMGPDAIEVSGPPEQPDQIWDSTAGAWVDPPPSPVSGPHYFVDGVGNYLGGFDGAEALAAVPVGAEEVPFPPAHAAQAWNGTGWEPLPGTSAQNEIDVAVEQPEWSALVGVLSDMLGETKAAVLARLKAKIAA